MPRGSTTYAIPDETLLEMLHNHLLEVDLTTGTVRFAGGELTPTICGTKGKNGTRYRLEICYESKKRTILRGRLVYLAGSRKPIPHHYEIHHLDGNRYNDTWNNLICLSIADHCKIEHPTTPNVPF